MRRRHLTLLGLGAAAAFGRHGLAQARPARIGILVNGGPGPLFDTVRRNLLQDFAQLGRGEADLRIDGYFARGQPARHPELVAEALRQDPDVIVALGGPAARAAQQATTTTPVVFAIVTDPVALGLVRSLERPGGNVTGITNLDPGQPAAQFALMSSVLPQMERVAILSDSTIPGADASGLAPIDRMNRQAAEALGLRPQVVKLAAPTPDIEAALAEMQREGAQAVVVLEVPLTLAHRMRIAELATARRLPTMFPGGQGDAGGLFAFGTTVMDAWRRIPAMVDQILRGRSPGEIPVEFITRRELVVNLAVAGQLGITLPEALVGAADRVIR
ncbi:ABC transporter substrate-binding protein [Neoroseomonas oryzicola]|uniref:ABC transporter substrate-binding protein n=1 Tax=Neoroseomonas oryzicola TaxID=535904 RepID=A0A9X9WMA6_9PROT|nr:ABC transporter substrate-binding protein [Neoroseomonas oryzicola]MBR0661466.1 hypothetical protein [Neoroseomonas oryzicola]NKE19953.1 hypothetical protein [Neoroseomonas oryzicola]